MNVLMDKSAKRYLRSLIAQPPPLGPSTIEGEGWSCWIDDRKLTSNPAEDIRRHVHKPALQQHLAKKGKMDLSAFDLVNWDANQDAFAGFPQMFRLWATKHVSGWCGVNNMMFHWKYSDTKACPCCGAPKETTEHLLLCTNHAMADQWQDSLDGLAAWFETTDTDPQIASFLLRLLRSRSLEAPDNNLLQAPAELV